VDKEAVPRVTMQRHGNVALVTMNDGERANALSADQVQALLEALDQTLLSPFRAIVIASSGRHFCAGADVRTMLETGSLKPGAVRPPASPLNLFLRLREDPRPVVLALDGLAAGGGVELALSADLIVAGPQAKLKLPELSLGVLPRTALVRLAEVIGRRRALELILTRRSIDANEALAIGLVNRVVASAAVVGTAIEMAESIVSAPPGAIAGVKRLLGRVANDDESAMDALQAEMDPAEWTEGFTAFLEKRAPDFDQFWKRAGESAAFPKQEGS
jgi:enoyl-CoA hydratase/carnithine racemase